jgi:dipeptidyl-peptidase-3
MRKIAATMLLASALTACTAPEASEPAFNYSDEKFADIQMLRYQVEGFEDLSLKQQTLIYYLSEASLAGRDILFDQNGRYNLRIRRMLETVYTDYQGNRDTEDFKNMTTYLKRVWFSSGIHHHYGCEKFEADFSQDFFREALKSVDAAKLPLAEGQTVDQLCDEVFPIIFDPSIMPMRVNQADGEDLVLTSAANYYGEGVTQKEAEAFYAKMRKPNDPCPIMYGMNSKLMENEKGKLYENVWKVGGLYGQAIEKIVYWLEKAKPFAENESQAKVLDKLIEYYNSGDLHTFDDYSILWLQDTLSSVDFVNGFTESYGDPLGMKASWEALVNYKNLAATARAEKMSENAQWFEDHAPIADEFKKEKCKGVSAKVITAAILGGDLYPSTAIGINLPNSDWVRRDYGSKSVTISNLTAAYAQASAGSGMNQEFVIDDATRELISKYGHLCDDLHTDLHECLGHGSGKLAPGVDSEALKAYSSTIEEARADLFGLYYVADAKMVELGLTPDAEAYKSQYYTYMLNGLMTQLVRIKPGFTIEEAHMRNRQLIARWAYEHGKANNVVELVKNNNKTYVKINDYEALRELFGQLLREIQRIKSTGDFNAARALVETYAVKVDAELHQEILERYATLNLAPYKGFINPVYKPTFDEAGNITKVELDYTEGYDEQMLRYSRDYNFLPDVNE